MKRKNPQSGPGIIQKVKASQINLRRKNLIKRALKDYKYMRQNTRNKLKRLLTEDA